MNTIAISLIAVVALLHFYFLLLEMVFWTKPLGMKAFRLTPEKAQITKDMAANQGLYNGFLAAGLVWSLVIVDVHWARSVALFFLICVLIAGVFGALSVHRKIFFIQGLPALLAMGALLFS